MATITETAAYALSLTYDELAELKAGLAFIQDNSFPGDDEGGLPKDEHLDHDILGIIAAVIDEVI